jgi:outer membrane autotransporter protein
VAQGAFTEQNAPVTGLSSASQSFDTLYSTLGVRVASSFSVGDTLWHDHAMVGWRHAYGDLSPERTLLFQETGASFLVDGTPIAANSAVIEAGIDAMLSRSATVGVAYSGALSNSGSSHAIKVSGGLQF